MCNNNEIKQGDRVIRGIKKGTVQFLYRGVSGYQAVVQWDGEDHMEVFFVEYLHRLPTISRVYNLYWNPGEWRVDSFWNETREIADRNADNDYRKRIGVLNVYDNGEVELEPCQQQKN